MSDLAVAVIVGRLTRDAELKYTNSGQAVAIFPSRRVAAQERRPVGGGIQFLGRGPLGQAWRVDQPVPDQGQARRGRGRHAPGQVGAGRPDEVQDLHLGQYRPASRILGGPGRLPARAVPRTRGRRESPRPRLRRRSRESEPAAGATILPTISRSDRLLQGEDDMSDMREQMDSRPSRQDGGRRTGDPSPGRTERIADRAVPAEARASSRRKSANSALKRSKSTIRTSTSCAAS